ncbi:MATE family efflux transporter [Clostridium sp. UBA6640]|uniref:MATE family efflux transporter n=1 Tax=Clostridium sp. UBA6640 TaxID=1946370 RepID=UPI0025C197EB|nr:MATE family efflux transporter [Clostridium sp. UBA6640]
MKNKIDARAERARLMGEGEMKSVLLKLSIPAIIAMLINAIYNMADTFFVGMLNDTAAIGAISVAFPVFMIVGAVGQAIGVGSSSYISRCLGENKKDRADKTATVAFFTAIAAGLTVMVLLYIFVKPVLRLVGASETIMPYAISYTKILATGAIFTITNMTLNNIIRAEGNSKYSMFAIILGAVLNIILDPIFILTFKMGVVGAAVATVIGQGVSTIFLISYFYRKKSFVKISRKDFSFDKKIYSEMLEIGIPTFIMQFLNSFVIGLINNTPMPSGDEAVAAVGIVLRINSMINYILIGYIQGFQPVAGYNYGAKKYKRVKDAIRISVIWSTIFCIITTVIMWAFATPIVSMFSADKNVITIGANTIIALGLLRPFLGYQMIYTGLFQALGKSKEAALLSIARQGLFFIPALLLLPGAFESGNSFFLSLTRILPYKIELGLYAIGFSQSLADGLTVLVTLLLGDRVKKEFKVVKSKPIEDKSDLHLQLAVEKDEKETNI